MVEDGTAMAAAGENASQDAAAVPEGGKAAKAEVVAKTEEVIAEAKPKAEGEDKPDAKPDGSNGEAKGNKEYVMVDGQKINKMKKRKVALYIGYYGANYQGMQKNPGAHTIEDVLELAIHKAGGISEENFGDLKKISWMRAARTDKGVSAACNVVSFKMVLEPEGVLGRINDNLPDDVRAFGFQRVTGGFCSRKLCDRRRYGYVLPLWALDPSHNIFPNKRQRTKSEGPGEKSSAEREEEEKFPQGGAGSKPRERTKEDLVSDFGRLLNNYVGTHNFHSYTKGHSWGEPQSKRHILKWSVETFELRGETYVKCEVLGQSFLYHQIRKMIGMALAISRGIAPENCLCVALRSRVKFNVPLAPEFPLYLEECVFNSYNKRHGHVHGQELSRDLYSEDIKEFKRTKIDTNIIESPEFNDGVLCWLRGINNELYKFSDWEETDREDYERRRQGRDKPRDQAKGDKSKEASSAPNPAQAQEGEKPQEAKEKSQEAKAANESEGNGSGQ